MKKLFILFSLALFTFSLNAQVAAKVHTEKAINQGEFVSFDLSLKDTLKSADTISYVFPVIHTNSVNFIVDLREKLVANDTTVAMTALESVDGITYYPILYGAVGTTSAYGKTLAKSITGIEYNGASDMAWIETRYLKLMFIAKAKSGFKKILSGYVKFNIR
jgi:hypothetical protein